MYRGRDRHRPGTQDRLVVDQGHRTFWEQTGDRSGTQDRLVVDQGHRTFWEQTGDRSGTPVVCGTDR